MAQVPRPMVVISIPLFPKGLLCNAIIYSSRFFFERFGSANILLVGVWLRRLPLRLDAAERWRSDSKDAYLIASRHMWLYSVSLKNTIGGEGIDLIMSEMVTKKATRIESDSMGPIEVPADVYWGAQTA